VAIVAGLIVAAALIVVPRQTAFESTAEQACRDRGEEFLGLVGDSGRYADPVPDAARCTSADSTGFEEIEVDYFASGGLAMLYRLACIVLPLGTGLLIGLRLSRGSRDSR
jgi:hypothetical protein